MKMGVTTQLASQGKLLRNTSCVGYSTTKVMNSEQKGSVSYSEKCTYLPCSWLVLKYSILFMCKITPLMLEIETFFTFIHWRASACKVYNTNVQAARNVVP